MQARAVGCTILAMHHPTNHGAYEWAQPTGYARTVD